MSSVIELILEMVLLLLNNTIGTLAGIFELLKQLFRSVADIGGMGIFPLIVGVLVLGVVIFFLGKFFFRSMKTIFLLFVIGLAILFVVFAMV